MDTKDTKETNESLTFVSLVSFVTSTTCYEHLRIALAESSSAIRLAPATPKGS
jgi:hypothetical protein